MNRNPDISLKRAQNLHQIRKDARQPSVIYNFYDQLRTVINSESEPVDTRLIFNCDESPFNLSPTKTAAIGTKGESLHRISGSAGRDNISVLACVRNTGEALPPLIVFKGKNLDGKWIPSQDDYLKGTTFAATSHGWMEEEVFFRWFTGQFISKINELRAELKSDSYAVLIFDGHASHVSFRIIQEAKQNKIHLIRLPAHLTDCLQPLDKTVFSAVKTEWDKQLVNYGREQIGRGSLTIPKPKFVELLCKTFEIALTKKNIKAGFESCGIFPVDEDKFPKHLFIPSELKKYLQIKAANEIPKNSIKSPGVFRIIENESSQIQSSTSSDDVPLNLSKKKDQKDLGREQRHENDFEVQSITQLFCQTLAHKCTDSNNKKSRVRVNSRYAEVLTTNEILERTRRIESQRLEKQKQIDERREKRQLKAVAKPKKLVFNDEVGC